ncbi:hypothetical protein Vi05172_g5919 [Venturia inaequalis]|nr:hypothetical protein Vi05172_g5919 [Venturia inaequalis]
MAQSYLARSISISRELCDTSATAEMLTHTTTIRDIVEEAVRLHIFADKYNTLKLRRELITAIWKLGCAPEPALQVAFENLHDKFGLYRLLADNEVWSRCIDNINAANDWMMWVPPSIIANKMVCFLEGGQVCIASFASATTMSTTGLESAQLANAHGREWWSKPLSYRQEQESEGIEGSVLHKKAQSNFWNESKLPEPRSCQSGTGYMF